MNKKPEPQQPDKSLRQKINKVLDDNSRSADEHEECIPREYYKEVVSEILALLKPRQPGCVLVENPYPISPNLSLNGEWPEVREKRLMCALKHSIFNEGREAQLAHDKQRMVKLPNRER